MLELDTVRGPHSTGITILPSSKGKDPFFIKKLGTPWDMYQYKDYDKAYGEVANVLMGHNRWATKGAINAINAHPFQFGSIIGAHNGTLRNQYLLDDAKDFDVDSENLYYHMEKNGLAHTVERLNGAFALAWLDGKDNSINFIRNSERPLHYTHSKDGHTVFWASEVWMLTAALHSAGIKHTKIYSFQELKHYKLNIEQSFMDQKEPLPKWKTKPMKAFVPPPVKVIPRTPINQGVGAANQNNIVKKMRNLVGEEVRCTYAYRSAAGAMRPYSVFRSVDKALNATFRIYELKGSGDYESLRDKTKTLLIKADRPTFGNNDEHFVFTLNQVTFETEAELVDAEKKIYPGYQSEQLSETEWYFRSLKGCAWCSDPSDIRKAGEYIWIAPDEYLCEGCTEDEDVKNYINMGALAW